MILLTGGSGQVGWELRRSLAPLGRVVAPTRAELDLTEPGRIVEAFRDVAPAAVVNCAAYTDVEGAERDPAAAHRLNAEVPAALAAAAASSGALMVHLSTDYVFDGSKKMPYAESDPGSPLSEYGRSKLEGERAVAAAGGPHVVVRTSWVYGLRGRNFLRTILGLAAEREELRVVDDQVGAPTWSRMLAEGLAGMLATLVRDGGFADPGARRGVYHLAAAGETSWHGFAQAILEAGAGAGGRIPRLVPVSTAEYGSGVRRPAYSVLECGRALKEFGVRLPGWREQLGLAMER